MPREPTSDNTLKEQGNPGPPLHTSSSDVLKEAGKVGK